MKNQVNDKNEDSILSEILLLKEELSKANELYFNDGKSPLTDKEYDSRKERYDWLSSRLKENKKKDIPELPDVGSDVKGRRKLKLSEPMLSLKKEKTPEDLAKWINKTIGNGAIYITPKIDGIAAELIYRDGKLIQATTRGDGVCGMDILSKIKNSNDIPIEIKRKEELIVRGELALDRLFVESQFDVREEGMHIVTDRNIVMGILAKKQTQIEKEKQLRLIVYSSPELDEGIPSYQFDKLEKLGFTTIDEVRWGSRHKHKEVRIRELPQRKITAGQLDFYCNELWKERDKLRYATDGIVFTYYDKKKKDQLGATKKYPNWARAFKFPDEMVETELLDIEWSMSGNESIIPIAIFKKVVTQGATLERASLWSILSMHKLDLRIGDTITVIRSGGVIPYVVGVTDRSNRNGTEKIPVPPTIEELKKSKGIL